MTKPITVEEYEQRLDAFMEVLLSRELPEAETCSQSARPIRLTRSGTQIPIFVEQGLTPAEFWRSLL